MFVKKDLRKIPKILSDVMVQSPPSVNGDKDESQKEILTDLPLSRRPVEFNGSISILCNPSYAPVLQHLVRLSLYDCQISSLDNIGFLASHNTLLGIPPNLQDLNIGRNPLKSLPDDLAVFEPSLINLWCDDCELTGSIPKCVMKLKQLQVLRMSNNQIDHIPGDQVEQLQNIRVLCLDGNQIKDVPHQIGNLQYLESLLLRKNKIQNLPEGVPGQNNKNMKLLHVSSNVLRSLPNSISQCTTLETIYANGNLLDCIPNGIGLNLNNLRHFNISHNKIKDLPQDFVERFGNVDKKSGECAKDSSCKIILSKNPIIENT